MEMVWGWAIPWDLSLHISEGNLEMVPLIAYHCSALLTFLLAFVGLLSGSTKSAGLFSLPFLQAALRHLVNIFLISCVYPSPLLSPSFS